MNLRGGLLRNASISLVMAVAGKGLAWIAAVLLARLLDPSGYGVYSFLLAAVTVLRIPAGFGLPNLLVREVSAARATGRWGAIRGVSAWAHRFSFIAGLPIIAALALVMIFAPHLVPAEWRPALPWTLALLFLPIMTAIRSGVLRGLKQVVASQLPEQIVRPAMIVAFLLLPFLWGQAVDTPSEAMAVNVWATLAAWLVGSLMLVRYWPPQARTAPPETEAPRWRKSLLPFGLANGMYVIDGQVGILVLGLFATSADVGIYKVAVQCAIFAGLGYSVVNVNIAPRLAAAWARQDRARLQETVTQGARLSLLFILPVALGFLLLGAWGIRVAFGADYAGAWLPLMILTGGHVVNSAFGSVTALLNMTHHEGDNTIAFAAGLAMSLVLAVLLAPSFGMVGVATATVASVTGRNLVLWRLARRRLDIEAGFWGRKAAPPASGD